MRRILGFNKKKEETSETSETSEVGEVGKQGDQEAGSSIADTNSAPVVVDAPDVGEIPDVNISSEEENEPVGSLHPSSFNRSSLFSRDRNTFNTFSTNPTTTTGGSSNNSYGSNGGFGFNSKPQNVPNIDNIGQPLRVVSADRYSELSRVGTSGSSHSTSPNSTFIRRRRSDFENKDSTSGIPIGINVVTAAAAAAATSATTSAESSNIGAGNNRSNITSSVVDIDIIERELGLLNENLLGLIDQLNQSVINISKASILFIELLDDKIPYQLPSTININIQNNKNIRSIIKIALQFYDNYLRFEVYQNSKNLLIKSLKEFLIRLNFKFHYDINQPTPFMGNFAINLNSEDVPNTEKIERIIDIISNSNSSIISDQQGSFIAPIMRGLTKNSSVLSIMFGFPDPQSEHYEIINALFQTFPDVHFFVKKDFIKTCAAGSNKTKFTPPFKLPNRKKPEISISISAENGIKTSGTLGGFIEPKFTSTTDQSLLKYKGSKFAITCAHVLLSENQDYPNVSVPSSVLLNAYRSALRDERDKYSIDSMEWGSYNEELKKSEMYDMTLGQVVWGERVLLKNKISDIAIVKINQGIKCENFLGDDMDFFNTSLKFKNLYIKKKIFKNQFSKHSKVFKIGANTKYTTGEINGIKLIYWLDGSLQTSEFIISSPEPNFANGGDSGALILNNLNNETGLGVLGMLHSYDGELKQFGLFTPVEDILERLHQVTGIEWDFIY